MDGRTRPLRASAGAPARHWLASAALATLVGACHVGPAYERPEYALPEQHQGADAAAAQAASIADLSWFELFEDEALRELIRVAVVANYDVQLAAERVLEARALYEIARGAELPVVEAGASASYVDVARQGASSVGSGRSIGGARYALGAAFSWELDFWGGLDSATQAARAEMLAAEESRRVVLQTLVTDLARAWFELRDYDAELAIAHQTVASRRASLDLVTLRRDRGVSNTLEVRQAEVLVATAEQAIPGLERRIAQKEHEICVLLGRNPGPVAREGALSERTLPASVPAGLPSDLLKRRPDILAAELRLVAANARIGEAEALLYPQIVLTAQGGLSSRELSDVVDANSGFWNVGAALMQPIFNGGRLRANVRATEARQREAVISYLQTIQLALTEVSDALVGYGKLRAVREQQEFLTSTLADQRRLSEMRYKSGVTAYLEVLDTDRQLFDAQLGLAQARRDETLGLVAIYRALGGGWVDTAPGETTAQASAGEQ